MVLISVYGNSVLFLSANILHIVALVNSENFRWIHLNEKKKPNQLRLATREKSAEKCIVFNVVGKTRNMTAPEVQFARSTWHVLGEKKNSPHIAIGEQYNAQFVQLESINIPHGSRSQ